MNNTSCSRSARDDSVALDETRTANSGSTATHTTQLDVSTSPKRHNWRWTNDERLQYIQAWKEFQGDRPRSVTVDNSDGSLVTRTDRVFRRFVKLRGGSTTRSELSLLNLKSALILSFQFITKFNRALLLKHGHGGGSRDWFSLSKAEKKHVKEANCMDSRVIDLSRPVYEALRSVVSCENAEDGDLVSQPHDNHDETEPSLETSTSVFRVGTKRKLQQLEDVLSRQDAQVQELLAELRHEREERVREGQRRKIVVQQREHERRREREVDRQLIWELMSEVRKRNDLVNATVSSQRERPCAMLTSPRADIILAGANRGNFEIRILPQAE